MGKVLTPKTACKILRSMGLISNSDNGYFEMALCDYLTHGDTLKAANKARAEREEGIRSYEYEYEYEDEE